MDSFGEILITVIDFCLEFIVRNMLPLIVLLLTFFTEGIVRKLMNRTLSSDSEKLKIDKTQFTLLKRLISAGIFVAGFAIAIYMVPYLRTLAVSLFAGAGILAVVIGFASQQAFSNIVSGIFIVIFKPFRVGDVIHVGTYTGTVEDITLRHTVIKNFENLRIIIPNSIISDESITNYNIEDERICKMIEIGISYDSDIDKAMKIMQDEAQKHPNCIDARTKEDVEKKIPKVVVRLMSFGDSSVNLRAWVWAKNPGDGFIMSCDLRKSIKERFDREGIEIPYPYRTIVMKNDVAKNKTTKSKTTSKNKSKTVSKNDPKKLQKKVSVTSAKKTFIVKPSKKSKSISNKK